MYGVASTCELRLFGHGGLWVDGAPAKLAKRATTLSLLGYLVLHRSVAVSRAALAYTLFPEESEEAALGELRRYLYLTNKLVSAGTEPWILADGETARWNPNAACTVDVIAFEDGVTRASTQAAAVALYTGDLWPVGELQVIAADTRPLTAELFAAGFRWTQRPLYLGRGLWHP